MVSECHLVVLHYHICRWHRFESLKCIFVHIPKNAGTSVEELLIGSATAPQSQHFTCRELRQHNPTLYDAYYRFCVIRNPYDRLVSAYEYLLNGGNKKENGVDVQWQQKLLTLGDFHSFVLHYFGHGEPDWVTASLPSHFVPQYLFICNGDGAVDVDCCLPFEQFIASGLSSLVNQGHISTDENHHSRQASVPPPPPAALVGSPSAPHVRKGSDLRTSGYDADGTLAELVYNAYKRDFELLGFERDSWRRWIKE